MVAKLCSHEYKYLKGDKKAWPNRGGAAWNVVYTWCRNNGLGGFGDPTDKGKAWMEEYETN